MIRFASFAAFALLATACSDAPRQAGGEAKPGRYAEKSAFAPLYAEEVKDGRIYLFGTNPAHDAFVATQEVEITKSKTFIGLGPNRETVIVQTDKDAPEMARRLVKRFHERWPATAQAQLPATPVAAGGSYK